MAPRNLPLILFAIIALAACRPADAQIAQRTLPEDATLLNLNEMAERDVTPDTIRARLMAQASSEDAATAQNSVNAAMTRALARVRSLGLDVETGGYNTYQETPPRPQSLPAGTKPPAPVWRAQQSLTITATDDAKLLEAVGILQNEGLLLQELGYMVSRQQQRGLQDELFAEALQRLTARAEKAAAALGLHFEGWARVGLNGGVAPRSMMVKAMRAEGMAAAAAPVAAPGEQTISVNVDGEAILRRR
ncbi:MAG TPA: SIMPL domain-containing protein [Ferrovibrio sp.]|uniref:SIMPL domain-containing protein n=1 Tax=Ferrovibrio sp. TaxID=1917215 RepID=UPI002B4B52BD|nr:SIMPL domain-containing protein [Ferrovibrio sp.]HLT78215.1 SIMPL domain-containing protein [Ferrovibrio sp.]